jgi:hypothetical protein
MPAPKPPEARRRAVELARLLEKPAGPERDRACSLRTTQPIFCDPYRRNRLADGLILINEAANATVGAAVIKEAH